MADGAYKIYQSMGRASIIYIDADAFGRMVFSEPIRARTFGR